MAAKPDALFFDIRMPAPSNLDAAAELADAWNEAAAPTRGLVRRLYAHLFKAM
jgi:DNA-binding LytR/AlgR family response regulator